VPEKIYIYEIQRKIELYCAYQERSIAEVKRKMSKWKLSNTQQNEIIHKLTDNNFIDERRFAQSYVSGKFRIKQWGKIKIKHYLKEKQISKQIIEEAINEIDKQEYLNTIKQLVDKKNQILSNETDVIKKKNKIIQYLSAKGYEIENIFEAIEQKQK